MKIYYTAHYIQRAYERLRPGQDMQKITEEILTKVKKKKLHPLKHLEKKDCYSVQDYYYKIVYAKEKGVYVMLTIATVGAEERGTLKHLTYSQPFDN